MDTNPSTNEATTSRFQNDESKAEIGAEMGAKVQTTNSTQTKAIVEKEGEPSESENIENREVVDDVWNFGSGKNEMSWKNLIFTPIQKQRRDVCWAIAIAGTVEARYNIEHQCVEQLSFQFLADHLTQYKKSDQLTTTKPAYSFIERHGLCRESVYPAKSKTNIKEAGKRTTTFRVTIRGYYELEPRLDKVDERELLKVIQNGPAVGIVQACPEFEFFSGKGIYRGPILRGKLYQFPFHAVIIHGYGIAENGNRYWLIRNSSGRGWGNEGDGKVIMSTNLNKKSVFWGYSYPKKTER